MAKKRVKIKATIRQRKAIERIIENRGNISRSMREVGYSPNTAKNPRNLTESDGFKELCDQYGLTDELILKSLVSDIKKKPKRRKPELELAAKIKGMLIEKKEVKAQVSLIEILDELEED